MDRPLNNKKIRFRNIAFVFFLTPLLLFILKYNGNVTMSPDNMWILDSVKLKADAEYHYSGGRSPKKWVNFYVGNYEPRFYLDYYQLECTDLTKMLSDLKKDTIITLKILRASEKAINSYLADDDINLFGVSKRGHEYVDLDCYNQKATRDIIISIIVCFILGGFSFYLSRRTYQFQLGKEEFKPYFLMLLYLVFVVTTCNNLAHL